MIIPNTGEVEVISEMTVGELKELLDTYNDNDKVSLIIYGSSDSPSVNLTVNNDIILSDDF